MKFGGIRKSAVASQPCPSSHITADKREMKDSPKFPSATSFIRAQLGKMSRLFVDLGVLI